ncbi:hypothetical protein [Vulcanisaeta sp. JCM 16161]|uniref:hypothetical protein n=1 Tax=Vulcanisaeta sp. JCM 16161 TaxID=1295372 RepID=UPI001FB300A4|nr:hypothetical protein [Vulcanisaeta sp. JCM 16161]
MTSIIERLGIEHIPDSMRHGRTMYQFTLWFASNLTVADYALGPILYMLGLPIPWLVLASCSVMYLVVYWLGYWQPWGLPMAIRR